ncbi:restriction endonuclease subunit S [Acinetobacter indicus]|uniref:restriction endonuclease subunit S n=1 Tax=Acinetobacter indicus TaxID=756892 RepID=UPI001443EB68|nr:restriction endonuclease subunit S [Acinetobacter indicus]
MSFLKMRLDQVCLIRRGSTITKNQVKAGNIPVVAGGKTSTISHNEANRDANTITVSASGASAGFVNFWQVPIFASDCSTVEVINELADINYVYYFLKFKQDYLYSLQAGAAQPHVYAKDIAKIEIPLPPLAEQRRIATILDQADELRQKRQQTIEKLDQLLQATFIDMFGDPVSNPNNYEQVELDNFILVGPQNGLYKPANMYGQGTPIVRIDGFKSGDIIDNKEFKRLSLEESDIEKYKLNKFDLVINRVNSPEYIGKTALIRNLEESTVFESNMMRFAVDSSKLNTYYLLFFLKQQFVLNQIANKRKDAVNQSSINQQDVKSLIINVPPIDSQIAFSNFFQKLEKNRNLFKQQVLNFDNLFKALQNQAFNGTL